ncbi:jg2446 [Pararge aegeria aegeria]|uniref:Jg2446 protein n=4 Tax=Pararge aegeria TaxID=116150 RepID=A0A8S4RZD8_9NEOP|nr:jg2446 [Pararge aegeria aegeria]
MYQDSMLPYAFGSESDQFAGYIKRYLDRFKKANLDCHFVFKGGHVDKEKLDIHFDAKNRLHGRNYIPGVVYDDIVKPIFVKEIWFQILNEMGFKYYFVNDNDDYITECITSALKLSCPLLGNNMQYFFSQVQYIPERGTVIDEKNNLLCGIYKLSRFLEKYSMTEEKIILFIMLTDKHIFGENVFEAFFRSNRMISRYNNIIHRNLMKWIAQKSTEQALKEVFKYLCESDKKKFIEKRTELENLMIERKNTDTKMALHVTSKLMECKFTQSDPDWFEKGVFSKYIPLPYVNLYKYKIIKASNYIEDYEQENSIMLSVDIVKYAFDLLTNFEGGEITVQHKKSDASDKTYQSFTYSSSIQKPDYEAKLSVFENGWDSIKELNLFDHFIIESLQTFDFTRLNRAPADSKLLLIALVYFSRKKPDVELEIYSILLSYVMLGVVKEKLSEDVDKANYNVESKSEKPFLDSFTDKELVNARDCDIAWSLMSKYFNIREDELCYMFQRKTLHPLVEFQRCLEELNFLNQLCGSPFDKTVYSKTYNGTFVYKLLYSMKENECQDGLQFIKNKLSPAPTVLAFLSGILGIYESILFEY